MMHPFNHDYLHVQQYLHELRAQAEKDRLARQAAPRRPRTMAVSQPRTTLTGRCLRASAASFDWSSDAAWRSRSRIRSRVCPLA